MLMMADVAELLPYADDTPVKVVKNELKYEWPSVMLFAPHKCQTLTPEYIDDEKNSPTTFEWAASVGELPREWNHLVGYDKPGPAKLAHYTQGIPGLLECRDCEYSREWHAELQAANETVSWLEIMGNSVHVEPVLTRLKR